MNQSAVVIALVVSSARKLILRPEEGAPVVSFPDGAKINEWGANNATPSIVVQNGTEVEPSWQGVDHEIGVVIVNEVPEAHAEEALNIVETGGQTNAAINQALTYLASNGVVDQYTCKLAFVDGKLTPAGRTLGAYTGTFKRDDRDLTPVWREGDIFYTAPNKQARVIEPDILVRTYRCQDGSTIDLDAISTERPSDIDNS